VGIIVVRKWIAGRDSIFPIRAVLAQRIEAQNLSEARIEILRVAKWIATAAAIGEAHIQEAEVGIALLRKRIEGEVAAVVIRKRLFVSDEFSGRTAIVGGRSRIFGCPFEKNRVVRVIAAAWLEIGGDACIRAIDDGVKLSE